MGHGPGATSHLDVCDTSSSAVQLGGLRQNYLGVLGSDSCIFYRTIPPGLLTTDIDRHRLCAMHAHNACTPSAVSTSNACARAWLQVCPLSVISNWETQIEEHSGGALSCIRYHGAARYKHAPSELAAADVVVTTYGIMASDKVLLKRVRVFSCSAASIWTFYVF